MRMFRQLARLFIRIIYLCDQDVFEGDPLLFSRSEIAAGLKQRAQVILTIDRHDAAAHVIRCAMQ
jgi:hypothetical protein